VAKHVTPFKTPGVFSQRFAYNGRIPHAAAVRNMAHATNFASQRMRKVVACKGCESGGAGAAEGGAGTERLWHFHFRSGVNLGQLDFMLGVVGVGTAGAATDPRVRLRLHDVSAVTNTYTDYYRGWLLPGQEQGSYHASTAWAHGSMSIPAEETHYVLSVETEDYGIVNALTAWERAPDAADDSKTGVCDPSPFEIDRAIRDEDIKKLLEAQHDVWRNNGAHLFGWTRPDSGSEISIAGSGPAWVNMFDQSASTTPSASTPGFSLDTQYHDTRNGGNINGELGITYERTVGAGNMDIRVRPSGSTLFTINNINGSGYTHETHAVSFPANSGLTKYDLQAYVDVGSTFVIHSLALWEYEA